MYTKGEIPSMAKRQLALDYNCHWIFSCMGRSVFKKNKELRYRK